MCKAISTPPTRISIRKSSSTLTSTLPRRVYRGRDAVRNYNENLFGQFESLRVEAEEFIDAGDQVIVVSTQHAVPKGGQQEIVVHMAELWAVRDDLLAKRHSYSTKDEALEAAGLSE